MVVSARTVQLDRTVDRDAACSWYHRTSEAGTKGIFAAGNFQIPPRPSGHYDYTKGVYFMNTRDHPRATHWGDWVVRACVKGTFIDVNGDGPDYWKFRDQFNYLHGNGDDEYDAIRAAYPDVDGMRIRVGAKDTMLVVWNPDVIQPLFPFIFDPAIYRF